jgi:two-component system, sensor histidine kinase and response regulator
MEEHSMVKSKISESADDRVKILLVDDRPDKLMALEVALGSLEQKLVVAHSGTEALRRLLQQEFALIVLDVSMPGMDGFETASLIRQRSNSKLTPIIFVSAVNYSEEHLSRGYSLGAVDYISAPIVPEILRAKVSFFIELHRKTEQLKRQAEMHVQLITELKQIEEDLRQARDKEQGANRAKSEFLSRTSHELRTPLNGIIGFAEFLIEGNAGHLSPKQKEYLQDIYDSGQHLLRIINDVLDLAKVEAGKMGLTPEMFSIQEAIASVCTGIRLVAQKRAIRVEVAVSSEVLEVTLDQQKFKQILYNLLSNAIKFTEQGGIVKVLLEAQHPNHFKLAVKDTGIGIKPEDLPRLFRDFEQLESGSARRHQGSGLGLALTKRFVELQGGAISVESEYGSGTTFSVVLPRQITKQGGERQSESETRIRSGECSRNA